MYKYEVITYFFYKKFKDSIFFSAEAYTACPFRISRSSFISLERNKLLKVVGKKRAKQFRPKQYHHMRYFWELTPKGIEFAKNIKKADIAKYFLKKNR